MTQEAAYLTPSQLTALREKATRPACTVPLAVVPATGLYPTEFAHLHEEWIEWPSNDEYTPNHPIIHIPRSDPCKRMKVKRGTSGAPVYVSRSEPCWLCKGSDTEQFTDPYRNDSNRVIPVTDKYAVDQLNHWFTQHDTIPWCKVLTTLNNLAEETINRRVSLQDLRYTFAARAVQMGFDHEFIRNRMALSDTSPRLRELLKKNGTEIQYNFQDYLELLHNHKPLSPQQIGDYLGRTWKSVSHRLHEYNKRDRLVAKVSEGGKHTPTYWTAVVPADYTIECSHTGCDKQFDSYQGRATHESLHCEFVSEHA